MPVMKHMLCIVWTQSHQNSPIKQNCHSDLFNAVTLTVGKGRPNWYGSVTLDEGYLMQSSKHLTWSYLQENKNHTHTVFTLSCMPCFLCKESALQKKNTIHHNQARSTHPNLPTVVSREQNRNSDLWPVLARNLLSTVPVLQKPVRSHLRAER